MIATLWQLLLTPHNAKCAYTLKKNLEFSHGWFDSNRILAQEVTTFTYAIVVALHSGTTFQGY